MLKHWTTTAYVRRFSGFNTIRAIIFRCNDIFNRDRKLKSLSDW